MKFGANLFHCLVSTEPRSNCCILQNHPVLMMLERNLSKENKLRQTGLVIIETPVGDATKLIGRPTVPIHYNLQLECTKPFFET